MSVFLMTAVTLSHASSSPNSSGQPRECGQASWYGGKFAGKKTANGEIYDPNSMTAAHRKLAFGTKVRVTRMRDGASVVVRINNRGPFVRGRVIDLSVAAAKRLNFKSQGVTKVCIALMN